MEKIQCKFVPKLIVPANALVPEEYNYITSDGTKCRIGFEIGWKNENDIFSDELDDVCQKVHGCSFETIKSVWFSRLGSVSDWWYMIKLRKNEN